MKSRSKALRQLARERSQKKDDDDQKEEAEGDDSDDSLDQQRSIKKFKHNGDSLLSNLPEPVNSKSNSAFDFLSEFMDSARHDRDGSDEECRDTDDIEPPPDMVEVDVSKLIRERVPEPIIAKTSIDAVKMPKSKEKEKNQITHLARLAKAAESIIQDNALQGRANKAAARSKYGW